MYKEVDINNKRHARIRIWASAPEPHLISEFFFFFFYYSAAPLSQVSLLFGLVLTQAHMSMAFPRQEYWSGLPFPTPGDLPNQGSHSSVLHWQAGSLPLYYLESPSAPK